MFETEIETKHTTPFGITTIFGIIALKLTKTTLSGKVPLTLTIPPLSPGLIVYIDQSGSLTLFSTGAPLNRAPQKRSKITSGQKL